MQRIVVAVSDETKAKLDVLRTHGYSLNGYVRALLERELMPKANVRQGKGKR
jgi:hypothetical protein